MTKREIIGLFGLVVATIGAGISTAIPEIRCWLYKKDCTQTTDTSMPLPENTPKPSARLTSSPTPLTLPNEDDSNNLAENSPPSITLPKSITSSPPRLFRTPDVPAERLEGNQVEIAQVASKPHSVYSPPVYVPQDVESMWVFLQNPNNTTNEGCTRLADPIEPDAFAQRIGEFINQAKTRNEKLIVTAVTSQKDWDSATREITIGGKRLNPMQSYYCNGGKRNYGYGVQ